MEACVTGVFINGIEVSISLEKATESFKTKRCQLSSAMQCSGRVQRSNDICFKTFGCDKILRGENIGIGYEAVKMNTRFLTSHP